MAESKKKSHRPHVSVTGILTPPVPPVASSIWITEPDGTQPVKCCFTVRGTADPGSYIHVGISEINGTPIDDPRPCYVWTDEHGNWTAYICVPTPPSIAAGAVIRVRACVVNPLTGKDAHCMDVPVTLGCACPAVPDTDINP